MLKITTSLLCLQELLVDTIALVLAAWAHLPLPLPQFLPLSPVMLELDQVLLWCKMYLTQICCHSQAPHLVHLEGQSCRELREEIGLAEQTPSQKYRTNLECVVQMPTHPQNLKITSKRKKLYFSDVKQHMPWLKPGLAYNINSFPSTLLKLIFCLFSS